MILIATRNPGKIAEIRHLLAGLPNGLTVYSLADLGLTGDCPENGQTFRENACQKAIFYSNQAENRLCLADDSGLRVQALNGQPGIYSARYAGPDADDEKNIQKLLLELAGLKNRRARFTAVLALARNGQLIETFTGEVNGLILEEKRGSRGFGYDPVFFYPPLGKTFAEISAAEKNRVSHRARAFSRLHEFLLRQQKEIKNSLLK